MASVTHLAAGALCGAIYARKAPVSPVLALPAFAAVALSPDLDLFGLSMGSIGTPFEHRVMTHSFLFAAVAGLLLGYAFGPPRRRLLAGMTTALALASHGLLDAMTHRGRGPRLAWPFSNVEVHLSWRPIPGAESFQEYFTSAAWSLFAVEVLLSLPILILTGWILLGARPNAPAMLFRRTPSLSGRPAPSND